MSNVHSGIRGHALSVATAIALSILIAGTAAAADRINVSSMQGSQHYDRFIVKYRDGSTQRASVAAVDSSLKRAARAVPSIAGRSMQIQSLRRTAMGAEVVKTERKLDSAEAESLMRQIAADPAVEYVEVDRKVYPTLTPNDPSFGQQFGLGTGAGGIRATQAWDSANGSGVVVAVIDTGITNHSDLNANIIAGYDFISDSDIAGDGGGRDADASDPGDWNADASKCSVGNSSWHGTHVAGTVAAVTNNGKGVAGVAWGAKVMPVRVLGHCGGLISDIADAIIWASGGTVNSVPANRNPAEVINMSLGAIGACDNTTQSAINSAVGRGTTVVAAAGNDNTDVSSSLPANCANVVAVGATTSTGARSSFSNYGNGVDVSAPGSAVLSTLNSGTTSPGTESYATYSGTSMATPHVAGVVALMQSKAATPLTPAQVETLLKSTARKFPSTPSQPIGAGIVDAKAAVDAVTGVSPPAGDGVCLFADSDYRGAAQCYTADVAFVGAAFNDKASSVRIPAGYEVTLFDNSNYGGSSLKLTGSSTFVGAAFNDITSSMRVTRTAPPADAVCVFQDNNYVGPSKCFSADTAYVGSDWNDRLSSVKVAAGYKAVLYFDRDYAGQSLEISANTTSLPADFNDKASSLKVIRK